MTSADASATPGAGLTATPGGPQAGLGLAVKLDSLPEGYVLKADFRGALGAVERTPQGGIRVQAKLARAGVLEYVKHDGKVVREYRPAEEIAKADSLATLENAPITDDHPYSEPKGLVSTQNFSRLNRGHVTGVKFDGKWLEATLHIQDATLIAKIDSGVAREISVGVLSLDMPTSGSSDDGPYDVVQTGLRYNHVAVVPRARAGADARIKLDSSGLPAREDEEIQTVKTIKIDGQDYPLNTPAEQDAAIRAQERYQAKLDAQAADLASLKTKADGLQAKLDAANAELTTAKNPATIEAAVNARLALRDSLVACLGAEEAAKLDGKSEAECRSAIVAKAYPGLKLDGKSADYMAAMYDSALIRLKSDSAETAANNTVLGILHKKVEPKLDKAEETPEAKFKTESANAYKTKLALSKA